MELIGHTEIFLFPRFNMPEEEIELTKAVKQPWLTEDERFRGKERYVDLCLHHKGNDFQNIHFDRKEIEKTTLSSSVKKTEEKVENLMEVNLNGEENDSQNIQSDAKEIEKNTSSNSSNESEEISDSVITLGDVGRIENENGSEKIEESTLCAPRVNEFDWSEYMKEVLLSSDTELLFNVLADLRSHTLVALGDDRLSNESAEQHLKVYKEYLKTKEARIMASVEKVLKDVGRIKTQKPRKKIDFTKEKTQTTLKSTAKKMEKIPEETVAILEEVKKIPMECAICNKSFENVDEHLLLVHYKTRILDDYPCSNFKCFFPKCTFVTIPKSLNYVKHIGLHHKILESLLKERSSSRSSPECEQVCKEDSVDLAEKSVPVHFQCPICPVKQVGDVMVHMSRHFADKVKDDFPFIKDESGYFICPIAECSVQPMSMPKLVQHINLDHEQINIYLKDANLEHIGHKKKRKLLGTAEETTVRKKSRLSE